MMVIFKYLNAPTGNPLPLPSSRAKRYPPVRRSNPLIMTWFKRPGLSNRAILGMRFHIAQNTPAVRLFEYLRSSPTPTFILQSHHFRIHPSTHAAARKIRRWEDESHPLIFHRKKSL